MNPDVWAKAARIIFAMAPSSAASERVFSLVKTMFGKDQITSMADFIQGSLMLRYNQRRVGRRLQADVLLIAGGRPSTRRSPRCTSRPPWSTT